MHAPRLGFVARDVAPVPQLAAHAHLIDTSVEGRLTARRIHREHFDWR